MLKAGVEFETYSSTNNRRNIAGHPSVDRQELPVPSLSRGDRTQKTVSSTQVKGPLPAGVWR